MINSQVGFRLLSEEGGGEDVEEGSIGSVSFLDSMFMWVPTAILVGPPSSRPGSRTTGLIIENCVMAGVTSLVADTSGAVVFHPSGLHIEHWVLGPVYQGAEDRTWTSGMSLPYAKDESLLDVESVGYVERPYFSRMKPQYGDLGVDSFVHVKDFNAVGTLSIRTHNVSPSMIFGWN